VFLKVLFLLLYIKVEEEDKYFRLKGPNKSSFVGSYNLLEAVILLNGK